MNPFVVIRTITFAVAALIICASAPDLRSQSLGTKLQWARVLEIANQSFADRGMRMHVKPPDPLDVRSDSLRRIAFEILNPTAIQQTPLRLGFQVFTWRLVTVSDVAGERTEFEETDRAFLGTTGFAGNDTLQTRDLRARLQYHFGDPTVSLAERGIDGADDSSDIIQFEYWFVINDSIPVMLIDVNGPWDRGLVISAPSSFRDVLFEIKESFLEQLKDSSNRMPFADYYYNLEQAQWYVTVFDGASFYDVRIEPPNLENGRPALADYISTNGRSGP